MSSTHDGIIDLIRDGGVLKKVLVKGDGPRPLPGFTIYCHYKATLLDGTEFDNSRKYHKKPYSFEIGAGKVIKGWDIGGLSMQIGEKAVLTIKPDYAYGDHSPEGSMIPPQSTLIFEIEMLGWEERKDVSLENNKSLMKRIKKAGDGGLPDEHGVVKVKYELRDADNKNVLDKQQTIEFVMGDESVPSALERVVGLMHPGEEATIDVDVDKVKELLMPPEHAAASFLSDFSFLNDVERKTKDELNKNLTAYRAPQVGAVMNVTLVSVTPAPTGWDGDTDNKLKNAEDFKQSGNKFFKQGRYELAIKKYKKALTFVEQHNDWPDELKQKGRDLVVSCHLNTAMCHLKMKALPACIASCESVLKLDENNVKALYRRACAYTDQHKFDEAEADLRAAVALDNNNKAVRTQFQELKRRRQEQKQSERKTFGGLFAKVAEEEEAERAARIAKKMAAK